MCCEGLTSGLRVIAVARRDPDRVHRGIHKPTPLVSGEPAPQRLEVPHINSLRLNTQRPKPRIPLQGDQPGVQHSGPTTGKAIRESDALRDSPLLDGLLQGVACSVCKTLSLAILRRLLQRPDSAELLQPRLGISSYVRTHDTSLYRRTVQVRLGSLRALR
jgi:hypothetical protein